MDSRLLRRMQRKTLRQLQKGLLRRPARVRPEHIGLLRRENQKRVALPPQAPSPVLNPYLSLLRIIFYRQVSVSVEGFSLLRDSYFCFRFSLFSLCMMKYFIPKVFYF